MSPAMKRGGFASVPEVRLRAYCGPDALVEIVTGDAAVPQGGASGWENRDSKCENSGASGEPGTGSPEWETVGERRRGGVIEDG